VNFNEVVVLDINYHGKVIRDFCCKTSSQVIAFFLQCLLTCAWNRIFIIFTTLHLVVPQHSLSTYGCWTFAVAGPTAWNSLSDDLRDPSLSTDSFRRLPKTRLLKIQSTSMYSTLEILHIMRYYQFNLRLTCLLLDSSVFLTHPFSQQQQSRLSMAATAHVIPHHIPIVIWG